MELSIEEKAKRYDEAKARMSRAFNSNRCTIGFMNEIFPELQESEDERIKKTITAVIACYDSENSYFKEVSKKKCLNWLEKQGEQKTSIWKHWKNGIAGNGEGKTIYLIKSGNTYSLSSCLSFECYYILLSDLDKLMLSEKQAWYKWDAEKKELKKISQRMISAEAKETLYDKPAWSEEDERNLKGIIDEIEANKNNAPDYDHATYDRFLSWLKFLRPQNRWKPSEEQMQQLSIVSTGKGWFDKKPLRELYEQLKKLREE